MADRSYATDNGFYLGDVVEWNHPTRGKIRTQITEIVSKGHYTWIQFPNGNDRWIPEQVRCSIVKLDTGDKTLDVELTRVE